MRVVTESTKGVTIHWPLGMSVDYMIRVLERLCFNELVKSWSHISGNWGRTGHFEVESLDGTDSGRLPEGDKIFVSERVVKEAGCSQRNWIEDGAVEYGPREVVKARLYDPNNTDDLQSLVMLGQEVSIEKNGVFVNGVNTLNSVVVEYLDREEEDRICCLGWINDEEYMLKEAIGVGERILPADCFGNPIVSKEG